MGITIFKIFILGGISSDTNSYLMVWFLFIVPPNRGIDLGLLAHIMREENLNGREISL